MNRTILALDVGGTFVKYGYYHEEKGLDESSVGEFAMSEAGTKEELVGALSGFLCSHPADLVSVSIPGPMDYNHGTSFMKHKFVSIYGIPLDEALSPALGGTPIVFMHDAVSFLMGELHDGNGVRFKQPAGVMLGTGLGFINSLSGRACINETDTPAFPLWSQPYLDGIAENYVSRKAMRANYQKATGKDLDVKEISLAARSGDRLALSVFEENGRHLGALLKKRWELLHFDGVVIGGQIARSLDLMLPQIEEQLPVPVVQAAHLSDAALRGAAYYAIHGKTGCTRVYSKDEIAEVLERNSL